MTIAIDADRDDPLRDLGRKLQVVRDHVTAVAKHFKNGLYLYGHGGTGKSYTILRHLESIDAPHALHNSRMTAKGLFRSLAAAPDVTHVLEDMERLTKDADAQGVLRSALWAQPGHERVVTWTTATEGAQRITFRGGLILISNRPLADLPELRALATRIEVYRLDVSDAEVAALMRDLASAGYRHGDMLAIEPDQCAQVTEFLIKECRKAGCRLDLRLQQKSFQTFLQHQHDHSQTHWEDLVAASVREATHHFRHEQDETPREDKHARRRNILREIVATEQDATQHEGIYRTRTGCARADYFRRKHEIVSKEFDEYDAGI